MIGYLAVAVIVVAVGLVMAFPSTANAPAYNVDKNNVAIKGYDTVAYFTEGSPTKGDKQFVHSWEEATWHFASASNRDLFTANPERYAPQYGGYCALGLSAGEYADIDPESWTIVDGKLYLNKTKDFRKVWRKAPEAYKATADYNWNENRDKLRINL
jgi:hypothetical protein